MNSKSTNLAWHYAGDGSKNPNLDPRLSSLASSAYAAPTGQTKHTPGPAHLHPAGTTISRLSSQQPKYTGVANSDAENLLALSSPYNQHGSQTSPPAPTFASFQPQHQSHAQPPLAGAPTNTTGQQTMNGSMMMNPPYTGGGFTLNDFSFMPGNMMIESQDVDMNMLGLDAMPWFDSYPMQLFDPNQQAAGGSNSAGRAQR